MVEYVAPCLEQGPLESLVSQRLRLSDNPLDRVKRLIERIYGNSREGELAHHRQSESQSKPGKDVLDHRLRDLRRFTGRG